MSGLGTSELPCSPTSGIHGKESPTQGELQTTHVSNLSFSLPRKMAMRGWVVSCSTQANSIGLKRKCHPTRSTPSCRRQLCREAQAAGKPTWLHRLPAHPSDVPHVPDAAGTCPVPPSLHACPPSPASASLPSTKETPSTCPSSWVVFFSKS